MHKLIISIILVALLVVAGGLTAWAHHPAPPADPTMPPCDRITGGGFIAGMTGGKANFGFVAGCQKNFRDDDDDDDDGDDDDDDSQRHERFGSLEYTDKSFFNLKLQSKITAYIFVDNNESALATDRSKHPQGTRLICGEGRARMNAPFGDVDVEWFAMPSDNGEPGRDKDEFLIQIKRKGVEEEPMYTNGGPIKGGNIELHKPPKHSTPNGFSELGSACPQF